MPDTTAPRDRLPDWASPAGQVPRWWDAVGRLEVGDWRAAMAILESAHSLLEEPTDQFAEPQAQLVVTLKAIVRIQIRRATGSPDVALDALSEVAERLARVRGVAAEHDRDGMGLVRLQPLHHAAHRRPLLWRVTRLAWREQAELLELRAHCRRAEAERDVAAVAVLATIEYLGWVEFDPWTHRRAPRPAADEFWESNDQPAKWFAQNHNSELQAMSTGLRHLAGRVNGDVSRPVIYDAGGYRGLRQRALTVLAARQHPPARRKDWEAYDVPSRAGPQLAWEHARRWSQYVNAG